MRCCIRGQPRQRVRVVGKHSQSLGIVSGFLVLQIVFGVPMAQAAETVIPTKNVPAVVERIFFEAFTKKIMPAESMYWKGRARSDKKTESALKGAMLFQKALGRTMPASVKVVATTPTVSNSVCSRKEPYPLAGELAAGMTVLKNGLLSKEPWKSRIPLKRFENCLRIKFANKDSEYAAVSGSLGVFFPKESTLTDLRIIINPAFAKDGHVLLGETVAHEVTHAWQQARSLLAKKGEKEFVSYKLPDCYTIEAEAFWTEISYIKSLAEADENDLRDVLNDAVRFSPNTKRGAFNVLGLLTFTEENWSAITKNPIGFLRTNVVMPNPAYQRQCGAT